MGGELNLPALVSAPHARAYFFFDGKQNVAREKATPESTPPAGMPGAIRVARRLQDSLWLRQDSDSPRRRPPVALRCSAYSRGTRKPNATDRNSGQNTRRLPEPLSRGRATPGIAEERREPSEGPRPEFRNLRQLRVAQEIARGGPPTRARLFLGAFLFAAPKTVTRRSTAENSASASHNA